VGVTGALRGASILSETKGEEAMERTKEAVRRLGSGYCYEAPGVYLWDEQRGEVERAARELARGNLAPRPTRRMLVIPAQEIAPAPR
jgi:hypothetical protein